MWVQFRDWFAAMPRGRKIQLGILSAAVITLAIVTVSLLTRTNWVLLPNTGDQQNTSQIYEYLNENNIPNRLDSSNRILVPEDRLGDTQMRLRQAALVGTAEFSMDILEGASGFGVTDQHAKILYDRQLGADISAVIMQTPRVQSALVIVNSGDTSPFRIANNTRQASASVMLTLARNDRLTQGEAQSIGDLVRTSVPGIEYENITITDNNLNTYRVGEDTPDLHEELTQHADLTNRLMRNMKENIEDLLSPFFGLQNIQVLPNVRLNFDRVIIEKEEFAPPVPGELEGLQRSSEELYEMSRAWRDGAGIPGTDTNYMGTAEYPWGLWDEDSLYQRTVLGRNYELNTTRTLIEQERGYIEELSIAVAINSDIEGMEDDPTEQVIDLVSKAIGVNPNNISVQRMPMSFVDQSLQELYDEWAAQEAARRNREIFETIMMYAVILLLGVMVMLLIRSIVLALKPPPEPEPILIASGPEFDMLVDDDDEAEALELEELDLHQKSAGLEQIERFIDKDSASVAQLLRNWLSDE